MSFTAAQAAEKKAAHKDGCFPDVAECKLSMVVSEVRFDDELKKGKDDGKGVDKSAEADGDEAN